MSEAVQQFETARLVVRELRAEDFAVAQLTPGRQQAGIFLEGSDDPIRVLD